MANYMSAWKAFRRLGDEPAATAQCLLSMPRWPHKDGLRILDIGCGDGRMLAAILQRTSRQVSTVTLVDPDEHLLAEAVREMGSLRAGINVSTKVGVADGEALELAATMDVGLAIHVVYLLPHNRFRALVDHWPEGVPLFVVLDAPDSVFTELWSQTASDYALRSRRVHEYLSGEANGGLDIRRTDFTTHVSDPFGLPETERDLILSLLCYCDFGELVAAKREMVEHIIKAHVEMDHVACSCTCYEIARRSG